MLAPSSRSTGDGVWDIGLGIWTTFFSTVISALELTLLNDNEPPLWDERSADTE